MPTIRETIFDEGVQKGVQQGVQQGIQQGILRNAREDVIDGLEIRFGQVPALIVEAVNRLEDMGTLKNLHKQVIMAKNMDEFTQALKESHN
ncbi:MAG: hypothetical protein HQK59_12230 [Deltaproteobacteria bacterium]|nr:hypothetical protein [Deltaproteobacteria bacterium]